MNEDEQQVEWPPPQPDPLVEPDELWDKSDEQALIPPAPVVPPLREP